jgi:hypothetical protein
MGNIISENLRLGAVMHTFALPFVLALVLIITASNAQANMAKTQTSCIPNEQP